MKGRLVIVALSGEASLIRVDTGQCRSHNVSELGTSQAVVPNDLEPRSRPTAPAIRRRQSSAAKAGDQRLRRRSADKPPISSELSWVPRSFFPRRQWRNPQAACRI
jgi:hypothetical protein